MSLHRMPTHQRCPKCVGRGTDTRGSLCVMCHGIGEIATLPRVQEGIGAKSDASREPPTRK